MPDIVAIREKVARGEVEYSQHAVDQTFHRVITVDEVRQAIMSGEVIEDYPWDKYGPSCLVYGTTDGGRSLHVQCSYPSRPLIKIVTVYEPDATLWSHGKKRRN